MREIKEAEAWLESAKRLLAEEALGEERHTVAVAQAIHSIIRANDALTLKFLGKRAIRHDDAPKLFLDLVRENKIPSRYADARNSVLFPAVQTKSKADYKGEFFSRRDALNWIGKAEMFLKIAKACLME